MYAGHLDLQQPLWFTIDGVLSPHECRALITEIEFGAQEIAPIHGPDGRPAVDLAVRNNTRLMFEDFVYARLLFDRVRRHLPPVMRGRRLDGVNEYLRLYRYGVGERHGTHWDTPVELADGRMSELTFVLYLNDDFEGGRTLFDELDVAVEPRPGRALLFQQRVLHQAEEIVSGTKYVLRSEIFYRA